MSRVWSSRRHSSDLVSHTLTTMATNQMDGATAANAPSKVEGEAEGELDESAGEVHV